MNILFLTTHANTGGITSYILTLGDALVKAGHQVIVVSSGGDCVPRMKTAGIRHIEYDIRTKSEASPKLWLSLPQLNRLIKEEKIDIIHTHTRVTQVLGSVLSRMSGIKMVTTCHGFFKTRWFRRTFPCWGEAVIAISKPVSQHLRLDFGVPLTKINLISNGIDLNRFKMTNDQLRRSARQVMGMGDMPLIGIIARLSDVKGIDILIKAMPQVLQEIPEANLIIIGQGPQEDHLKKLTQDLSLTTQVQFRSTIDRSPEFLPGFDVFAMPSLMEGLGLSVMEAQACGIPVIASKVGGLVDLIEYGETGYLVETQNESALANRIIDVLKNPKKSKMMAERARSNIERYFSADKMMQETLKVYEQYSRR